MKLLSCVILYILTTFLFTSFNFVISFHPMYRWLRFRMSCMCENCSRWTSVLASWWELTFLLYFIASLLPVRHHVWCLRVNCVLPQCPACTWLRWGACSDITFLSAFLQMQWFWEPIFSVSARMKTKASNYAFRSRNQVSLPFLANVYTIVCFRTCWASYKNKHRLKIHSEYVVALVCFFVVFFPIMCLSYMSSISRF